MKKEVIKVNGMSCAHCEGRVNKALGELGGVKKAEASASKNQVTIKFDENTVSVEKISEVIREAGYEVVL